MEIYHLHHVKQRWRCYRLRIIEYNVTNQCHIIYKWLRTSLAVAVVREHENELKAPASNSDRAVGSLLCTAALQRAVLGLFLYHFSLKVFIVRRCQRFQTQTSYSLFSNSVWWWVNSLFQLRGEKVFQPVCSRVISKTCRAPKWRCHLPRD